MLELVGVLDNKLPFPLHKLGDVRKSSSKWRGGGQVVISSHSKLDEKLLQSRRSEREINFNPFYRLAPSYVLKASHPVDAE